VLYVVSDCGGILLGARVNGQFAGFVLGFLGRQPGSTLFHASHMLGVLPEHQRHGIGAALKWQQRSKALEQGLDLMTWTFDPLESRNAYFNLHKLGAISRTYREDYYGPMEDGLNQGLPSDRLVVEWRLRDDGPRVPIADSPRPILRERAGLPELELDRNGASGVVSIQVPRDVQEIKRTDPDAALTWRLAARRAFSWALDAGYTVHDFSDGAYILVPPGELTP
jgi:predicted GNAT superfamily acetyltransferase